MFAPDLIVAPFLKRAIPEAVWKHHRCIVIHPGIEGDRGPSALDWAVLDGESRWGVTALQANAEMDAGDIWASVEFDMRPASKGSLYRNEVTEAAVEAVRLDDRAHRCRRRPRAAGLRPARGARAAAAADEAARPGDRLAARRRRHRAAQDPVRGRRAGRRRPRSSTCRCICTTRTPKAKLRGRAGRGDRAAPRRDLPRDPRRRGVDHAPEGLARRGPAVQAAGRDGARREARGRSRGRRSP